MLDPRAIARVMEDLSHDLHRWDGVAREEADRLRAVQAQLAEQADVMRRLAMAHADEVALVAEQAEALCGQARHSAANAQLAAAAADAACAEAAAAQAGTLRQLQRWRGNEATARADLLAAEQHLVACETALQEANVGLLRAEYDLQQAQAALSRCLNSGYRDQQGRWHEPNCGGHQGNVSRANNNVAAWAVAVMARRQDSALARGRVVDAQARVRLCMQCVQAGVQASEMAADAVVGAGAALAESRRAVRMADRAAEHCVAADSAVQQQQGAVDRLDEVRRDTLRSVEGAAAHEAAAHRAQDDTARQVSSTRADLAALGEILDAFDRPRTD